MRLTHSPDYTQAAVSSCLPSHQKVQTAQMVSPVFMCVSHFPCMHGKRAAGCCGFVSTSLVLAHQRA